jgi:uncharacterized OB-fold protein
MAIRQYCWRCKSEVDMLDESEWAEISPLLTQHIENIKEYRRVHGALLPEALAAVRGDVPLAKYLELTGSTASNVNVIWEHRASLFGPPCKACGKPLRTPRASFCASCGVVA